MACAGPTAAGLERGQRDKLARWRAALETVELDIVLLEQPGRVRGGIVVHALRDRTPQLVRARTDHAERHERESHDAGSEQTLARLTVEA
jgi:hypothetical protein